MDGLEVSPADADLYGSCWFCGAPLAVAVTRSGLDTRFQSLCLNCELEDFLAETNG